MDSIPNNVYIFTMPHFSISGRNCCGTVVALEFCYSENLNSAQRMQSQAVFDFLIFARNGIQFPVSESFTVRSTPDDSRCRTDYCCGTTTLDASNQFELPSSSFTFGVQVTRMNVRPLAFTSTVTRFNVAQYQSAATPGDVYTFTGALSGHSLQLLRFILGITIRYKYSTTVWPMEQHM